MESFFLFLFLNKRPLRRINKGSISEEVCRFQDPRSNINVRNLKLFSKVISAAEIVLVMIIFKEALWYQSVHKPINTLIINYCNSTKDKPN